VPPEVSPFFGDLPDGSNLIFGVIQGFDKQYLDVKIIVETFVDSIPQLCLRASKQ